MKTGSCAIHHEKLGAEVVGTVLWESTRSGVWGNALFAHCGDTLTADARDFAELDALRPLSGV